MDERLERHLCNLHNEVFEAAESRINTECSLTIREGISMSNLLEFPQKTALFVLNCKNLKILRDFCDFGSYIS